MSLPRARLGGDVVPQQTARGRSSPLRGRSTPRELPPPGGKQATPSGKASREQETEQPSADRRPHIDIVGGTRREWWGRVRKPSPSVVGLLHGLCRLQQLCSTSVCTYHRHCTDNKLLTDVPHTFANVSLTVTYFSLTLFFTVPPLCLPTCRLDRSASRAPPSEEIVNALFQRLVVCGVLGSSSSCSMCTC